MQSDKELIILALKLAIRTHSDVTGRMLFHALDKLEAFKPKKETFVGSLYMHALKYDNVQLICRTLDLHVIPPIGPDMQAVHSDPDIEVFRLFEPEIGSPNRPRLDKKKLGRLFSIGSSKVLESLILEG